MSRPAAAVARGARAVPAARLALAALLLGSGSAAAQSRLADRIQGIRDGTIRFAFAVREGICGDGETFIRDRSRGDDNYMQFESRSGWRNRRDLVCIPGPARVEVIRSDGVLLKTRVYVGGDWSSRRSDATDLGDLPSAETAHTLVALATRDRHAEQLLFAATIADSVEIWPDLLALARNTDAPKASRKSSVFWLSQAAGDAATKGLAELAEDEKQDREVRDQAVFALSQLKSEAGIPALIRVARTNRDPEIRRKALFWLGQSDDPRVLTLFEELLTKPR